MSAPVKEQPPMPSSTNEGQQSQPPPPAYAPNTGVYQGEGHTLNGQSVYNPPPPTYAQQQSQPPIMMVPSPYSQPQQPIMVQQPVYYVAQPPPQPIVGPIRVVGGAACGKCGTVYPLPSGSYSWRCKNCNEFNNLQGDQCAIL